jgi:NAD(P)-dependent dehydrogenase (short-subunit alcohol dehydrogenase family)
MNINLNGRKAIVTGSTAGIGRAVAEGLARAGASVIINGRGNVRVDEAVRHMRRTFPESAISGIAADLCQGAGHHAGRSRAVVPEGGAPNQPHPAFRDD